MAPKSAPPAAKQQSILRWFHDSVSAHSFKDLEKALPVVASISGMVVKDYLQALSDEGLIRVEKIGSGNWYWSFLSDAKQGKEEVLGGLRKEEKDATTKLALVNKEIEEESAARQDDDEILDDSAMSRDELMAAHVQLTKEVRLLESELEGYKGNDPTELLRLQNETKSMEDSAERWTDNIETVLGWLKNEKQVDREGISGMMAECGGEDWVPGEGLRDLEEYVVVTMGVKRKRTSSSTD